MARCSPPPPPVVWGSGDTHLYASTAPTHISRGHSLRANLVGFGIFPAVFELFVRCAKISLPLGGVCVYSRHRPACEWERISSIFASPAACVPSQAPTLC